MQFKANDGSSHPSQMAAFQAGQKPAEDSQEKPSIQDNPKAMQAVDDLKQMGYTGEEVSQAMDDGSQMEDKGAEATKAAPLNIPGVGMQ
jgi:ubiquitin